MNTEEPFTAPSEGIMIKNSQDDKYALLFDPEVMRFISYRQKPKSELEDESGEEEEGE